MNDVPHKIVFCFPYRGVGGVSLLFLRLAEALMNTGDFEVGIVDYENGFMAQRCPDGVQLIVYPDSGQCDVPEDALIVFQAMTPWSIFPNLEISDNSRVFFWGCHPFNFVPHVPVFGKYLNKDVRVNRVFQKTFFRSYWLKAKRFLLALDERKAIAFMDQSNFETADFFYGGIDDTGYLPIPAASVSAAERKSSTIDSNSTLRLMWLGRIVDFKFHILAYTLKQFDKIQPSLGRKVIFTVVGAGEYTVDLERIATGLNNIEISFVNEVNPEDIDKFVLANADLMFAMGTSALESAKLAVPTILLDVFYASVKSNYHFRFLSERTGCTLGDVVNQGVFSSFFYDSEKINQSLMMCANQLYHEYEFIGQQCHTYFMQNHSMEAVVNNFLKRVSLSDCKFIDLKKIGCLEPGWLYGIKKLLKG